MSDKPKKFIAVAPSPLNEVKLDLAIGFLAAIILFIILEYSGIGLVTELCILAGFGAAFGAWIIWRTRKITALILSRDVPAAQSEDKHN